MFGNEHLFLKPLNRLSNAVLHEEYSNSCLSRETDFFHSNIQFFVTNTNRSMSNKMLMTF